MNKEKKQFKESRMEILQFSFNDVITTSSTVTGGVDGFDVNDPGVSFTSGMLN